MEYPRESDRAVHARLLMMNPGVDTDAGNRDMRSPRSHWIQWAGVLRRYQLDQLALWLLDTGRPLAILSAQALYIGQPILGDGVHDLASLLESDEESRAFAAFLNGEGLS